MQLGMLWKKLEPIIAVLLLLYINEFDADKLSILDRLLVALYYLFIFIITLKYWKSILYFLTKDKILLLFLLLPLASILWSTNPDVSQARFNRVALRATLFGTYLASRYSLRDLLRLITITLGIATLLNTASAVALPGGRMGGKFAGAWQGLFPHKNYFARLMVWITAHFAALAMYQTKERKQNTVGFAASLLGLLLSQSKSSLAIGVGTFTLLPLHSYFLRAYRSKTILVAISICILFVGTLWVSSNVEYIVVDILGKTMTLSGRTTIWEYFFSRIATRPWLGYGYEAFWTNREEIFFAKQALPWFSGHAHSGYIDLALQFGIVGLSLFLLSCLTTLIRIVYLLSVTKAIEYFLMLIFLFVMLASQFSVGITILKDNIFWVLYITFSSLTAVETTRIRFALQQKSSQELDTVSPSY